MTIRGKIITSHVRPPIPTTRFDWVAYHDGEEETGHYGYGSTELEALSDLYRLDQERREADGDLDDPAAGRISTRDFEDTF